MPKEPPTNKTVAFAPHRTAARDLTGMVRLGAPVEFLALRLALRGVWGRACEYNRCNQSVTSVSPILRVLIFSISGQVFSTSLIPAS